MFNEDKLREEIIKTWGPAGAHIELFNDILRQRQEYKKALEFYAHMNEYTGREDHGATARLALG